MKQKRLNDWPYYSKYQSLMVKRQVDKQ